MDASNPIALGLEKRVEALLFTSGETLTFQKICKQLECSQEDLKEALRALQERLKGSQGGLELVFTEDAAALVTAESVSEEMAALQKQVLERDIGPAGLEIVAILLYRGPATRARIDYIRGVNSSSTLRTLVARQLVERVKNPEDAREMLYKPTTQLLAHLGVVRAEELPEYGEIRGALAEFESRAEAHEFSSETPEESYGGEQQ